MVSVVYAFLSIPEPCWNRKKFLFTWGVTTKGYPLILTGVYFFFLIFCFIFQKILWIGPVKFGSLSANAGGTLKLGAILDRLRKQNNLEIIVDGKVARRTVLGSISTYDVIESASIVWEFLKGRNLPGLMALDRVCVLK